MPFTMPDFRKLSMEEVAPWHNALQTAMSNLLKMNQVKYDEPMRKEALQKEQLYNQYYGPDKESEMGLRGAQTGHYNAQTRGQNITNQYLPKKLQAEIASAEAGAEKARLLQMIREQMMGGGQSQSASQNMIQERPEGPFGEEQPMPQGQGMLRAPEQQVQSNQQMPQQPLRQPMQNSGISDYGQAATAMQALGLGKPHVVEANGKFMAITPFGNFDTGVSGLGAEEKALKQGFGKYGAKLYGESIDSFKSYQNQGLAINELVNAVENNPQFRNVTGRINKPLTNWLGSAQQKELLGTLQTASGEIALQVAPSLKGAWTGRDQAMINEIKAGPNDFPDVFIGKLKAQKLINDALTERSRLTAEYIEKGYKPLEAAKMASFETPLERFRTTISELIKHKKVLTPYEIMNARNELAKRGSQ